MSLAPTDLYKSMHGECKCWIPRRGPIYWDWRCLNCDGRIYGFFYRWKLRRRAA